VLLCFSCSKPSPGLLPLLHRAASPPCPECEVRNPLHLDVDPAFEPRLDRAL
jgi:hypothetical protein